MFYYDSQKHHRRSIRLKGFDYAKEALYFITICAQDRNQLFGRIEEGKMILNEFGKIAQSEWQNTDQIRTNCIIHQFIIMPDHIHGIIEIIQNKGEKENIGKFKSPSQTIGSIIRGYKIATIKKIKEFIIEKENHSGELELMKTIKSLDFKIWQRNYFEKIIRDEKAFKNITRYIIDNPKKMK